METQKRTGERASRIGGVVLLIIGIAMPIFFLAIGVPKAFVLSGGPATLLIVFGILMATGRMPQPPR